MNPKNEARAIELVHQAAKRGLPVPVKRNRQQTLEIAKSLKDEHGEFVVPREIFEPAITDAKPMRFVPVPEDIRFIPTTRSSKLVITIAIGKEHQRLLRLTGPLMQRYARLCGADFTVLAEETQGWWGLEKFRVKSFAQVYDRVLFVDADVIIRDGSPSLFELVPPRHIAMHDDWPLQPDPSWVERDRAELFASQGVPQWHSEILLNTGVVMCERMHANIWTGMTQPFPGRHTDEQLWIERWSRSYPLFKLPVEFNTQWYFRDFFEMAKSAWFVHLANCPAHERYDLAARFLEHGNRREVDR